MLVWRLLLSFYFHVILEHLKTFKQTNFRFKKVLYFAIQDAWTDFQAFAWSSVYMAAEKALMWVKTITDFSRFCYLNIPCLRINIALIFMSSSSEEFTHKWENSRTDVSVGFQRPCLICLCPLKGTLRLQSFINLGKTFFRICRIWTIT